VGGGQDEVGDLGFGCQAVAAAAGNTRAKTSNCSIVDPYMKERRSESLGYRLLR